ncbi:TIGR03936 family radical SAM-associated protein, partial [bacterium]|nr:TIGR03936 family radical SAM-associated protein [bacterium]
FVPKPFTPFQWMGQASIDELNRKTNLIRDSIRKRRLGKYINLKWRDPKISYLECVLGRGDRRLSDVIYTAYKNGAVFDGWTDQFRFDIWEKSLEDNGISDYLGEKSLDSCLPWDHINKGVSKQFLKSELQKAFAGEYTDDCREKICYNCGIADSGECVINKNRKKNKKPVFPDSYPDNIKEKEPEKSGKKIRIRIWFAKKDFARFLSHLDLSDLFSRGARMSETSIYYTKGFNPHPKISFGPALPTGYIGLNEYFDIITEEVPVIPEFIKNFQAALPLGITINNAEVINSEGEETVSNSPKSAAYRVLLNSVFTQDDVKSLEKITLDDISDEMYILKKEDKKIYVKKYIEKIQYLADRKEFFIVIKFYNNGTLRVEDLLSLFMKGDKKLFLQCTIIRENIFF